MTNIRHISSGALFAAGAFLMSGSASATWLYISAASGHAYDVSKTMCFPHDEPGRVHYKGSGCTGLGSLWHVPVPPIRNPQLSTLYVYAKDDLPLNNSCYVTVMAPSGQALRWDSVTIQSLADWYQFDPIQVNATETVVVECDIANTTNSGTSWMGSVKYWD